MSRFKYAVMVVVFFALFLLFCVNEERATVQDEKYQDAYEIWSDMKKEKEIPYIRINGFDYFRFQSLEYNYIDEKMEKPLYTVIQKFDEDLYETNKKIYGYKNDDERMFLYYDMGDPNISPVCLYYRSDLKNLEVNKTNVIEIRIIELENTNYYYSIVNKRIIELFLSVHNSNFTLTKQRQLFKQIVVDENILKNSDYQSKFQIVACFKDYPHLQFTLDYIDFFKDSDQKSIIQSEDGTMC